MEKSFKQLSNSTLYYLQHHFLKEVLGVTMMSIGIQVFAAPNNIVGGGVTGLATLINHTIGIPIGMASFTLNLPLIIIGFMYIGKAFMVKTFRTVVLMTILMDTLIVRIPVYQGEKMLAACFGGVMMGIGMATVLSQGSSTAGSDIIVKIIHIKNPHISLGKVVMLTDIVVVLTAVIVYKEIETLLYGIIMIYACGETMDKIIKGADQRWMLLAITSHHKAITNFIIEELHRSSTIIDSEGGYSEEHKKVLMCVLDGREMFTLKAQLKEIDPKAFVIVCQAAEILGEGFKELK